MDWRGVFDRLRLDPVSRQRVVTQADRNGTTIALELLATGLRDERTVISTIADELGLRFVEAIDPRMIVIGESDAIAALRRPGGFEIVKLDDGRGGMPLVLAPHRLNLADLRAMLAASPSLRSRLTLATPDAVRRALLERAEERLVAEAREGLLKVMPEMSARNRGVGWLGFVAGVMLMGFGALAIADVWSAWLALQIASSFIFLACVLLRVAASVDARHPGRRMPPLPDPHELPVYSILVALRNEAEIVPDLLVALGKLQWPRTKLEIKIICEADDQRTLAALAASPLRSFVEILRVPPSQPRTKPKALAYALPLTRGEFVVLYDAEDRPHPLQLVEAYRAFRASGPDLACLQAPLVIANRDYGVLPRMFWFEYSALFSGLLPWLAARGLLLPLGGTSNHFRRDALIEVGGWDPYNVTEDADLGARLARFGYGSRTLTLPTLEDAPERLDEWLPQRTRWFKGWIVTWKVHMRHPLRLYRELGAASFLVLQVLFLGMVLSALVHPMVLGSTVWLGALIVFGDGAMRNVVAFLASFASLFAAYSAFLLLGARTLPAPSRREILSIVAATPFYWLLLSAAAWRALGQSVLDPHRWEKTPHRRFRRARRAARRSAFGDLLSRVRPPRPAA